MTFGEIRADVFRRLRESTTSPTFWTVADVDAAINEGYLEMSDASEWRESTFTIDLKANRPYYDLRTLFDRPILSITGIWNPTTSRWLEPRRVSDFDQHNLRWESVTGTPQAYCLRGAWWLGLYPRIAADLGTVTVRATTLPDLLEADGDEPGFPAILHRGLVKYAEADLWMQDAEVSKGLSAWQQYLQYEAALIAAVDGRMTPALSLGLSA